MNNLNITKTKLLFAILLGFVLVAGVIVSATSFKDSIIKKDKKVEKIDSVKICKKDKKQDKKNKKCDLVSRENIDNLVKYGEYNSKELYIISNEE